MSKCGNKIQLIFFLRRIFGNEIVDHVEWKRHCAITKKNVCVKRYFKYQWYTIFNGLSNDHRCILHLFIICNDLWCQLPFFSQTFRYNGSAVFGTMPPMCRSCPDVNKLRGMDSTILGQHRPFMSIKSFVQHSEWQEMVSLCSLIRLIGVCADRDKPEFLCSRSDSGYSKSMWPQGEAG